MVSGKRSNGERDGDVAEAADIGIFHELVPEMADSLVVTAKRRAIQSSHYFTALLKLQADERDKNNKLCEERSYMWQSWQ